MGDPSSLRFVPASNSATPIDWTHVPEATKQYLIKYYVLHDERKPLPATIGDLAKMFDKTKFFGYFGSRLITVLMDISEFGLQPTSTPGRSIAPAGPRFYMKYTEQLWFLLFAPGTRECIVGYSDDIIRNYHNVDDDNDDNDDDDDDKDKDKDNGDDNHKDKDNGDDDDDDNHKDNGDDDGYDEAEAEETYRKMEEAEAAEETAMAQAFDVTLEQEVSRGMGAWVEFTKNLGGWTATTLESDMEYTQYAEAIMTLPTSHPA